MGLRQDEIALICGIAFIILIEVGIWIGGFIHWEELGVYLNLYDPRFPTEKGESWYVHQYSLNRYFTKCYLFSKLLRGMRSTA